ncbi:hypothetical protein [Colwellia psychrerythraea]|uniref:Uncharacterized protein n=1 Tax=Colwellia psychrerythraea TaxID=28229 RepID=A0A099KZD7_COLPS|nr:hypothetical protein [Colwellia psychrerythraea]KGJ95197.1 hypothetical protein GAB14E_1979 [Colwellia psychrerythraea]
MSINYSNYTLDELLDVNENINRDMYPERYKQLCEEIQRRKKNGEFERKAQEIKEKEDEDDEENEFIIEFSSEGKGTNRKLFILVFILINMVVLAFVLPKYMVSDLSNIHEYSTEIDFIECHKEEVIDDETDEVYTYFDLNIGSYQDTFSAVGIGEGKCKNLARDLKVGTNVSIWHEGGLIHQLKSKNSMLLPYAYMKSKVQDLRTGDANLYWFGLVALWFMLFKSVANAVVPGTFTSNK